MNTCLLDYEITPGDDDNFHVWTPDNTGGIIGTGDTREAAMLDAIKSMASLQLLLAERLKPVL